MGRLARLTVLIAVTSAVTGAIRAADIAYYVGAWNPGWYDATQFDDVTKIIANTKGKFLDVKQFADKKEDVTAFEAWAKANMKDNEPDVIWLNGCMPNVLYPYPNKQPDGSLAEEWLYNGNIMINVGDWFGYVSYECGGRCAENGTAGAANILNLAASVIGFGDNTALKKTPTATKFMPSLKDTPITFRPVAVGEVKGDWEVAAIFASNTGDEKGTQADPIVIHNKKGGGYLAIINQSANNVWIDRASACSEFINLWMKEHVEGFLAVAPAGKLATTWGRMKR